MIKKLLERRVPQLTGAYLAVGWVVLEFTDWAVNQYALSPAITDFVVTLLAVLIPAVVVLAWRHGKPGADEWTKVDGAVIGCNVLVAAGVLVMAFSGEELGPVRTVRLLEDEAGNTVERVIPKAAFRRDVLLYDFDNPSGDPDLDWLTTGFVMGIGSDLAQDVFITLVDASDARVSEEIGEAGFTSGESVPLALKRRVAEQRSLEYFVEGVVDRDADSLIVTTHLYETRSARQLAARTYRGTDPLEMVDRISVELRRDLGIPNWQIEEAVDLPAAELLTHSPEAFRALGEGERLFRANDLAGARAKTMEAAALDSTSAMAHAVVGSISLLMGDQQEAKASFARALRYGYRLPERTRMAFRTIDGLFIQGDPEAAVRAGRYWTEVYPQDIQARRLLGSVYAMTGNTDGQISQYRAVLALDSTDVEARRALASAFGAKEEYDSAFVYYRQASERLPSDVRTRLAVASTLTRLARFDEAREELEQAQVVAPDEPDVLDQLARLDMQLGHYEDAARRVAQATALQRTPEERYTDAGLEETLYYERGQFGRLADAYRRRLEAGLEVGPARLPPISLVGQMAGSELLLYAADAGLEEYALAQLDSLGSSVEPPWRFAPDRARVRIHLARGDVQAARESLEGIRTVARSFGDRETTVAYITWIEGRIAELEDGDCRRALESYDRARELVPRAPYLRAERLRCLTSLERWKEAEEERAWLLERWPGTAKFRVDAARLYAARGETDRAIAELEAALDIWSEADPGHRPSAEARRMLDELRRE